MRAAAVPVLLCCAALTAQSWPTFFSAYLDGLDAQKRGDHALACRAFTRAIALEPQPGLRVKTYGLNFLPRYFPYLRLAESALALGDLAGAEAALAQSELRGMEPAPERTALRERLSQSRHASAVTAPPPAPTVVQPSAPAEAPARSIPALPAPAPPILSTQPILSAPPAVAQAPLPAARQETRRASAPPATLPAPPAAVPAPVPAPLPAPAAQAPAAPPAHWRSWGMLLVPAGLLGAFALLRRRGRPRPAVRPGAVTQGVASGLMFGPYLAKHELGRGGCATAYFGCHRETGAEVAIKVPHPHLAQDPEFRARFRREASLGALLDHPRVVKIVDPGPSEGDPWLAMAFIRGTTLEAFMAGKGPLPVPQAVTIASEIAEAIAYAHGKGVVHRDLKPANVMLGDQGAVVMDFGIARMLDTTMTSSTMYLGTPLYSAPEGILGARVGPPADRYALGVILFEMLAGHPPFESDTLYRVLEAQRFDPLPDLAEIRPHTPPRLIRLVERLCAKAPEERPEDPETLAILAELNRVAL
jgi:hypothetical protein